jgi:alkyl hydroperoxide reductase subunit F
MAEKTNYDLIILGAGPAGMTAAVYAARKQIDVLVITQNVGGQTTWSSDIENYLGFRLISGPELVAKFEEHMSTFGIPREFARVTRLTRPGPAFRVETEDGGTFTARAVIVATGKSPRTLGVPGEKQFTSRGVTYCATCDGPLFAGKNVAVVGGGNSGLDAAIQLMKICPKVYIVEVEEKLRADEVMVSQARAAENVEILTGTSVTEILGDQFVNAVMVTSGGEARRLDVEGVFVEVGLIPNSDLVRGVVRLNPIGEIPVDCAARTGIPGLYAAGDVTDVPEKQIIIAAGDGAKAALGAYSYLVRLPGSTDWSCKTP